MRPQPLLYLHPAEKWERECVNDPPTVPYRAPLLGLIWTVLALACLAVWGVGVWLFVMWRLS